ncbi:MAG: ABC transporter permease subunit, partial [Klebsiella pneumoniae]
MISMRGGLKEGFVKTSPYGAKVNDAAKQQADDIKGQMNGTFTIYSTIKDNQEGNPGGHQGKRCLAGEHELAGGRRARSTDAVDERETIARRDATSPLCPRAGMSPLLLICSALQGKPALEAGRLVLEGAFGSSFAWENTLQRAAPLMLTALCVALPARAGLIIIGGEGALVLGGLAAAVTPLWLPAWPPVLMLIFMALAAMVMGGAWIGLSGWMRQRRGVNETISSLLLSYIAIALFRQLVEGP